MVVCIFILYTRGYGLAPGLSNHWYNSTKFRAIIQTDTSDSSTSSLSIIIMIMHTCMGEGWHMNGIFLAMMACIFMLCKRGQSLGLSNRTKFGALIYSFSPWTDSSTSKFKTIFQVQLTFLTTTAVRQDKRKMHTFLNQHDSYRLA